jgi:hypothetical protein
MALSTHRTFTFPVVLAVSAGLGLTSVVGLPAPASAAAPVIAGVPEPPDRQKKLEKALITEKDVPAGYAKEDLGDFGPMLAAILHAKEPGGGPCEVPGDVSSLTSGTSMTIGSPMIPMDEPVPTVPPGTTPAPSAPSPSAPSAPEPVKASPPPPPVIEPDPIDLPPTAAAVFVHESTGAVAAEVLSVAGEDTALELVDQVQEILEDCPMIEVESFKITTQPLAWNPPLGDESITASLSLEARFFGVDVSAHVKLAQVAYRDVALTVGLIGADDPKDREFKKITRAAVRKLVLTSGISTKN